jgi:hypothetical protein
MDGSHSDQPTYQIRKGSSVSEYCTHKISTGRKCVDTNGAYWHTNRYRDQRGILKLYLQAINELPKDVKKILMYSEKFVSESRLLESSPPKEWYKLWLENINDHNRIVLCGKCQNKECSIYVIFIDEIYNYIRKTSLSDKIYYEADCTRCSTKNSLHIYTSMDALDFDK